MDFGNTLIKLPRAHSSSDHLSTTRQYSMVTYDACTRQNHPLVDLSPSLELDPSLSWIHKQVIS